MEFKGTKGKWLFEKNEDYPLHEIWNNGGLPTLIARTCYSPLSEPNAKLIASAPELLEMLVKVSKLRILTEMSNPHPIKEDILNLIKQATT